MFQTRGHIQVGLLRNKKETPTMVHHHPNLYLPIWGLVLGVCDMVVVRASRVTLHSPLRVSPGHCPGGSRVQAAWGRTLHNHLYILAGGDQILIPNGVPKTNSHMG